MLRKFAATTILEAHLGEDTRGFVKGAHRAVFNYTPRHGYLYVRSRAISSRCNDNFDQFPAEEIEKSYLTFIGKPVFVNHHNDDHRRMRGLCIDAALHRDVNPDGSPDTWAEVLMEIDAIKFPKLAEAIIKKKVDRTSMGCFVGDTQVTLSDGSTKRIDDIELGDLVLTHTGKIEPVTYVMQRDYVGTTYTIHSYGHARPIVATEEHPFWIKRSQDAKPNWVEAKDVRRGDWVLTPANRSESEPGSIPLATLLGYFLAEGNLGWDRKRKGYENAPVSVEWNFDQSEIQYIEEVRSSLLVLGYNPTKVYSRESSRGVSIRCNSPALAAQLMELGGQHCEGKRLSEEAMGWGREVQKALLFSYFNGDGCYRGDRVEAGTASEQLAHQLHGIALRVGLKMTPPVKQHSPSASHKRPKWVMQTTLMTKMNKDGSLRVQGAFIDEKGLWRKVTSVEEDKLYSGSVYNFDVKGDDSYVAGDIAVHNCDVQFSKCSACGNVATSPSQYCEHIPGKKGKRLFRITASGKKEGQLIFEVCSGLSFFENSLLVEQPADPTAFFLGEVELGPGLDHLHAAKTAARKEPVWVEPNLPKNMTINSWKKTASRQNAQSPVWDLLAQAAQETVNASAAVAADLPAPTQGSHVSKIWSLISEASTLSDLDAWGFEIIPPELMKSRTAAKPPAGVPQNNAERHALLDKKTGNGKGVRNLLDLVHTASASDHDLNSGMKWYDDAHGVAKTISEHHRQQEGHVFHGLSSEDALHRTAGTIGVYSSSSAPAPNMHMAMDAIHHGQAIYSKPIRDASGKTVGNSGFNPNGEGHEHDRHGLPMADDKGAAKINGMLHGGKSIDESWKGSAHKTHNFAHLIADPDSVDDKGRDRVVVDRHAIAAVLGHKGSSGEVYDNPNGPHFASILSTKGGYDKVADMYRSAADHINSSDEFKPLREKLQTQGLLQPGERVRGHHVQALTWVQQKKISGSRTTTKDQQEIDRFQGAYQHRYGPEGHKPTNWQGFVGGDDRHDKAASRRYAYGETKAPQDVDTLRAENCTVCGNSSAFDGTQCQVCGYVAPPRVFGDPNTDIAKSQDLRKEVIDGVEADPNDPNQQLGNQVGNPDELDDQASEAEEEGAIPPLSCTNCGTGIQPAPPQSEGGEPPYPAEGDICPVCKKGELASDAGGAEEGDPDEEPENSETDTDSNDVEDDEEPTEDADEEDSDDKNPFAKKKTK